MESEQSTTLAATTELDSSSTNILEAKAKVAEVADVKEASMPVVSNGTVDEKESNEIPHVNGVQSESNQPTVEATAEVSVTSNETVSSSEKAAEVSEPVTEIVAQVSEPVTEVVAQVSEPVTEVAVQVSEPVSEVAASPIVETETIAPSDVRIAEVAVVAVEEKKSVEVASVEPVAQIAIVPDIAVNQPSVIPVDPPQQVTVVPDIVMPDQPSVVTQTPVKKSNVLPVYVMNELIKIAESKGYVDFRISISEGSQHGDGFIGDIFKATISDGKTDNKAVLIVKMPPENELRRQMMGMRVFKREAIVYNEILPLFEEFQRKRGLNENNGFFSYPRCYFAHYNEEKDEAALIMDDIRVHEYSMENRFRPTKYEHAKSLMIHLGRLHAVSFAMKDQCPEQFNKYNSLGDVLSEIYDVDTMKALLEINLAKALDILGPGEEKIKQKVKAYVENMNAETKRLNDSDLAEPHAVLIHGDCHINNIMFAYESGIPKYCCLFDWQLTRYASPAIDLAQFIFLCTDKPLRDQHYDHLIQAYHNSLREQLERLGSDVNQLFPFTALLRQMKIFARLIMGIAVIAIPMLCLEREDLPDMDEMADKFQNLQNVKPEQFTETEMFKLSQKAEEKYRVRMGGVMRDMVKKGYL